LASAGATSTLRDVMNDGICPAPERAWHATITDKTG
jgi:hypothetical protein